MCIYNLLTKLFNSITNQYYYTVTSVIFKFLHVHYSSFRTKGKPIVKVGTSGILTIGTDFTMNNGLYGNLIGFCTPCIFQVANGCHLTIGNHVGISQTTMIALADITIGNNVKIGGGTRLYTTDFHSLDADIRRTKRDKVERKNLPIIVGDDVFIGAGCFILKGVTIGNGSVVAAGSVVTKSIPAGEIWGGNPAKFIRRC